MKKLNYTIVLLCMVLLASCSIPFEIPKYGVWYCEELRMSIDFALVNSTPHGVKVYDDNGVSKEYICHIGYDQAIYVTENEGEEDFFSGFFEYDEKNQIFIVTTKKDKIKYIFNKLDADSVDNLTGDDLNPLKK